MSGTGKILTLLTLAAILSVSMLPFFSLSGEADADQNTDADYVFYRYSIKFFSTSSDTKFISWDFGDGVILDGRWEHYIALQDAGEDLSEEILAGIEAYRALLAQNGNSIYCPIHTYAAPGVYTYTITAYNPVGYVGPSGIPYDGTFSTDEVGYDGGLISGSTDSEVCGSTDMATIVLDVRGYPVVSFDANGGTDVDPITVENTSVYAAATEPSAPVKEGYAFAGWYTDAGLTQAYDWSSLVTEDIILYAMYTPVGPAEEKITVIIDGADTQIAPGTKVSEIAVTEKDGKRFTGWFLDEDLTVPADPESVLTAGMTLYAGYEDITGNEDAIWTYVPYIFAGLGIIVILLGYWRYSYVIMAVGAVIVCAGILECTGILDLAGIIDDILEGLL